MLREISIEEVKLREMDILKYILKCCKENDIQVFLGYGSLIGAVRHRGIIPWDDDIDLMMLQEDCEKFRRVFIGNDIYKLNISGLDDAEDGNLIKRISVEDVRTLAREYGQVEFPINVHIFPLYPAPTGASTKRRIQMLERIYKIKRITKRPDRAFYKKIFLAVAQPIAALWNDNKIAREYEKLILDSKVQKDKLIIPMDPYFEYCEYDKSIFEEAIEVPFEDILADIPSGYDKLLTMIYGDYMTPPPEDRRAGHSGFEYFMKTEDDA